MNTRTIPATKKHRLADGTYTTYTTVQTYTLKGYARKDGTRTLKPTFSDEQKEEIRQLRSRGITKKRLMTDFGCSQHCLDKILSS